MKNNLLNQDSDEEISYDEILSSNSVELKLKSNFIDDKKSDKNVISGDDLIKIHSRNNFNFNEVDIKEEKRNLEDKKEVRKDKIKKLKDSISGISVDSSSDDRFQKIESTLSNLTSLLSTLLIPKEQVNIKKNENKGNNKEYVRKEYLGKKPDRFKTKSKGFNFDDRKRDNVSDLNKIKSVSNNLKIKDSGGDEEIFVSSLNKHNKIVKQVIGEQTLIKEKFSDNGVSGVFRITSQGQLRTLGSFWAPKNLMAHLIQTFGVINDDDKVIMTKQCKSLCALVLLEDAYLNYCQVDGLDGLIIHEQYLRNGDLLFTNVREYFSSYDDKENSYILHCKVTTILGFSAKVYIYDKDDIQLITFCSKDISNFNFFNLDFINNKTFQCFTGVMDNFVYKHNTENSVENLNRPYCLKFRTVELVFDSFLKCSPTLKKYASVELRISEASLKRMNTRFLDYTNKVD